MYKYAFKKEDVIKSQYCSQSPTCEDDRCDCVDVVEGEQVKFIGSCLELANLLK